MFSEEAADGQDSDGPQPTTSSCVCHLPSSAVSGDSRSPSVSTHISGYVDNAQEKAVEVL